MRCHALVAVALIAATLPTAVFAQWWGLNNPAYQAQIDALSAVPVSTLSIPVLLGVEVSDLTKNFGDPRDGGVRTHEGLDILAAHGMPVVSPTDAVVTRTGNGADSGLYVRTANPGGETFVYMHLAAIAERLSAGDVLQRGDVIGFVGNTGNASGGPSHLHFEIRKGSATDPYPRLTKVFSLAERMQGVTQALERLPADGSGAAYPDEWATRFASVFREAQAQGISVSPRIVALPETAPSADVAVALVPVSGAAPAALVFGESNADIVALQQFLIAAASGDRSAYLRRTGATGYFGPITQAALAEYQSSAGLASSGVVDDATYTQIFALNSEGDSSEVGLEEEGVPAPLETASLTGFTRDLEVGMRGEDVRELQRFLNTHGFLVAESDEGSPGQETTYFGALTRAAVVRYQAAYRITPTAGYVGPITRASFASSAR